MAGGLRSHIQANAQNSSSSSSSSHPMMSQQSSSSHPMMSQQSSSSQSGGRRKKRKSRSRSRSRSRRAGTTCSGNSSSHKGGMGGLGAVIKEALVPFGLFAWQKRTQRRTHNGKKSRRTRRR